MAAAGYQVLGVEVSAEASAEAKAISAKTLSAESRDRFEFLNYDALALVSSSIVLCPAFAARVSNVLISTILTWQPRPVRRIDFLIDFTVYCALRHRYLARMYELWDRVLTPVRLAFAAASMS